MYDVVPPADDQPDGLDVEEAFGEHDIEYWVWSGNHLVPASPEQIALIREDEARRLLPDWQRRAALAPPRRPTVPRPVRPLGRLLTRARPIAGLFRSARARRADDASPPARAPRGDGRTAVEERPQ